MLLGLLNLVYEARQIPSFWKFELIIPIKKAGKASDMISSHRPISLLAALFKVFDKLLLLRVWTFIADAVSPWQGGGLLGADTMTWTISKIFICRRRSCLDSLTLEIFVDGESAFCRPPAIFVI